MLLGYPKLGLLLLVMVPVADEAVTEEPKAEELIPTVDP